MKWRTEDVIAAPIEQIERALFDRETIELIPKYMKSIARTELLSIKEDGPLLERAVYYYPSFSIPWFAKRVDHKMTEWTEYVSWDLRSHAGAFRIEPNMPDQWRPFFNAGGRYWLETRADGKSVRYIEADLTVKYGMMAGGFAERIIIGIIKRQFHREAKLLASRCVTNSAA